MTSFVTDPDKFLAGLNIGGEGQQDEEVSDAEAEKLLAELNIGQQSSQQAAAASASAAGTEGVDKEGEVEGAVSVRKRLLDSTGESLERGTKLASIAGAHDAQGDLAKALELYDNCIALFAQAMEDDMLSDALVARVTGLLEKYLDRCREIRVTVPSDQRRCSPLMLHGPASMEAAVAAIARGGNVLKRGVALFKEGKRKTLERDVGADGGTGETSWEIYVIYTEATQCLLSYLKSEPGKANAASRPAILKCVSEMLDVTEAIKQRGAEMGGGVQGGNNGAQQRSDASGGGGGGDL